MLDDNQQRALCEYLDMEFRTTAEALGESAEYFPYPNFPIPEIHPERRTMGVVKYSGLRLWHSHDDPEDWGWVGQIYGQRSDGQMFYVVISWRPHKDEGDPEQLLRSRFENAVFQFGSYRDCSCGIIGHRDTGEKDKDGDPIMQAINSPCKTHPRAAEPPEVWLTVDQVAERLQLGTETIRRYISDDKLPAVKIGSRSIRVSESDLKSFMAERSNQKENPHAE